MVIMVRMVKSHAPKREVKTAGKRKWGQCETELCVWGRLLGGSLCHRRWLSGLLHEAGCACEFLKGPPPNIQPETELAFAKYVPRKVSFNYWFTLKPRGLECAWVLLVRQVCFPSMPGKAPFELPSEDLVAIPLQRATQMTICLPAFNSNTFTQSFLLALVI